MTFRHYSGDRYDDNVIDQLNTFPQLVIKLISFKIFPQLQTSV